MDPNGRLLETHVRSIYRGRRDHQAAKKLPSRGRCSTFKPTNRLRGTSMAKKQQKKKHKQRKPFVIQSCGFGTLSFDTTTAAFTLMVFVPADGATWVINGATLVDPLNNQFQMTQDPVTASKWTWSPVPPTQIPIAGTWSATASLTGTGTTPSATTHAP